MSLGVNSVLFQQNKQDFYNVESRTNPFHLQILRSDLPGSFKMNQAAKRAKIDILSLSTISVYDQSMTHYTFLFFQTLIWRHYAK